MLPNKWGNYPTPNYNSGKCATCGHDVDKHASRLGTCMAGTCSCLKFVQIPEPKISVVPTPTAIKPAKPKWHGRRDHESIMEWAACPVCQANQKAEE